MTFPVLAEDLGESETTERLSTSHATSRLATHNVAEPLVRSVALRCLAQEAFLLFRGWASQNLHPSRWNIDMYPFSTRHPCTKKLVTETTEAQTMELEQVRRKLVRTSRSAAATKRELGRNARDGPLVRHGPD